MILEKTLKCTSAVLKVASRCNLNCSYCYMYNLGDESYKHQPKFMSQVVVESFIKKIRSHCEKNNIKEFFFIFHGGEPLLAPKKFFLRFIELAEEQLLPGTIPLFNIQSNATLITEEWCEFFEENNISLSISLDGYEEINDRHRVYHNGKGSFHDIVKSIHLINQFRELRNNFGILSVINIQADPEKLLEFYSSLNVLNFDLLLPNANFEKPPHGKAGFSDTAYGDWLIKLFDLWYTRYSNLNIRLFSNLIATLLGGKYSTDAYGEGVNEVIVLETDGGIESVDVLKICGDGFTKEGLNILTDELEEAFNAPLINEYLLSHERLSDTCSKCSLNKICGGGYIPHRFSKQQFFNNPTIYCRDLAKLICHIQNIMLPDMPEKLVASSMLNRYTFDEFLSENLVTA
jgi:uncharacterized protein